MGGVSSPYGGVTSTNFNLPDFRSKFPVGKGTDAWSNVLAESGGSATAVVVTHTHSVADHIHSISHNHNGVTTAGEGSHSHVIDVDHNAAAYGSTGSIGITTSAADSTRNTQTGGLHQHTLVTTGQDTANSGSSGALLATAPNGATSDTNTANLPPYITVNYLIKT